MKITHERVTDSLSYDPNTGYIVWKNREWMHPSTNSRTRGKRAGSVLKKGRYTLREVTVEGVRFREHILIWFYVTGEYPPEGMVIDHKNRDATDNRWENLQLIPRKKNALNVSKSVKNTSGHTGVYRSGGRWRAVVTKDRKKHHLGYFDDAKSAAIAVRAFKDENGFSAGSGEDLPEPEPRNEKSLGNPNSVSGCRFISKKREKWTVVVERRTVGAFNDLHAAKQALKEYLDMHPNHPFHGYPIPQ